MQVKSIAECSPLKHSAILLTSIKLSFVIKIFVLSIFEWPFYTGFTEVLKFHLSHDVAYDSGIMPCIKIDKPLVVHIFSNGM